MLQTSKDSKGSTCWYLSYNHKSFISTTDDYIIILFKEEVILETIRKIIKNGSLYVLTDFHNTQTKDVEEITLKRNLNTWETNFLIRILIKYRKLS